MTFNEVLSQTIAMLHQHGRVSYRALKRQFAIQDDYLEEISKTPSSLPIPRSSMSRGAG